ncbi:MAG: nitroreductase family deazaflavin-dependent oxidoreductase [Panacagrimonas sp.]|jgi:deazaflavin-dependent oxidoreductase (nitroreductase family)|nr:nitroreductase family deazaflavin-dependent oxidoreductase [Panacagrimonas sp.]MCC2654977.1 nitroreductase family deazaflavin-dependent oxidoreductase [Panacagrimonas sp.]
MSQAGSPPQKENAVLSEFHENAQRHDLPDWIKEHVELYHRDPVAAHEWDGSPLGGYPNTPTLMLTTRGRKSGKILEMPLLYGRDGDHIVICGSKGGAPQHPAWFLNMEAMDVVDVQIKHDRFKAKWRLAKGDERQRLFEMMTKVYPPFPSYQARTPREIPVVVLERI